VRETPAALPRTRVSGRPLGLGAQVRLLFEKRVASGRRRGRRAVGVTEHVEERDGDGDDDGAKHESDDAEDL
jgi:hypothetical protein